MMPPKIYMHQGEKVFLEENLRKSIEHGWNRWSQSDKMMCAFWASPFNDKKAYTWENFWYADYGNVERKAIEEAFEGCGAHEEFAQTNFYTISAIENFYKLPIEKQIVTHFYGYDGTKIFPSINIINSWHKDAQELIKQCKSNVEKYCKEYREDAFFFTVDDDKILHINSMKDIGPYIVEKKEIPGMDWTRKVIDYDAIRADGYAGIELCNVGELRWDENGPTMFNIWDCDSIAIWDPNCIKIVDRELACISRLSQFDALEVVDKNDPNMTLEHLSSWIVNNQTVIDDAKQKGILTQDDIDAILSQSQPEKLHDDYLEEIEFNR